MTKYTTVEGHEIKVGETYEMRDGNKVRVLAFNELAKYYRVVGCYVPDGDIDSWTGNGSCFHGETGISCDLMRPWKEAPTEVKQSQRIPTFRGAMVSGELGDYHIEVENTDVFIALSCYVSKYLEKYMANKE